MSDNATLMELMTNRIHRGTVAQAQIDDCELTFYSDKYIPNTKKYRIFGALTNINMFKDYMNFTFNPQQKYMLEMVFGVEDAEVFLQKIMTLVYAQLKDKKPAVRADVFFIPDQCTLIVNIHTVKHAFLIFPKGKEIDSVKETLMSATPLQ